MSSLVRARLLQSGLLFGLTCACSEPASHPTGAAASSGAAEAVTRAVLSPSSIQLLEMAFRVASAMPANPHLKARSRAQEDVALACLDLGQPDRAHEYLQALGSWRRGTGLTRVALHLAQSGATAAAERCLAEAEQIATTTAANPNEQAWRVDRIRAGIAGARVALGQPAAADAIEAGLDPTAQVQVLSTRARVADVGACEQVLAAVDQVLEASNLDTARGALDACVVLFDRCYAEAEHRERAEHRVLHGHARLPIALRVDLVLRLVDISLGHADASRAARLLDVIDGLVTAARWLPEDEIVLRARRSVLRHKTGEGERADRDLRLALAMFEANLTRIVDIARADVLRAVADARHAMGQRAEALRIYRRAVEAGVENPNSRPRAEDLVATCLAMARLAVEPDPALRARMLQVERSLTDPW